MRQYKKISSYFSPYLQKTIDFWLGGAIGLCLTTNILNTARFAPDASFLGEAIGTGIVSFTLAIYFAIKPLRQLGLSTLTWLILSVIVVLQTLRNNVAYPDELIFPFAALVVAFFTAIAVSNIDDRKGFMLGVSVCLVFTGLFTVFIQLIQLFFPFSDMPFILSISEGHTPYGNIGQRNHVAFILVLSIATLLHFNQALKHIKLPLLIILLAFLAIGMGMTPSRGGIILFVFTVIFWLAFGAKAIGFKRKKTIFLLTFALFLGFLIGAWLLNTYSISESNLINRVTKGGVYHRLSLLNQAWVIFQDNLWLGIGWNNFNIGALSYVEQLRWFYFATHSHSVIPQIGAELGVVGLLAILPVIVAIIATIKIKFNPLSALVINLLAVFILYSFSEYPLWYSFYLFLFVGLVALTEKKWAVSFSKFNVLAVVTLLIIFCGSLFYFNSFLNYAKTTAIVTAKNVSKTIKSEAYKQQKNIYGFSGYNELLLFYLIDGSPTKIQSKLALGYRVIGHNTNISRITKLAILEAVNGNNDRSLFLFKSACLFNEKRDCDKVTAMISDLVSLQPDVYSNISSAYKQWLESVK